MVVQTAWWSTKGPSSARYEGNVRWYRHYYYRCFRVIMVLNLTHDDEYSLHYWSGRWPAFRTFNLLKYGPSI